MKDHRPNMDRAQQSKGGWFHHYVGSIAERTKVEDRTVGGNPLGPSLGNAEMTGVAIALDLD